MPARFDTVLRAAGLLDNVDDIPEDLAVLSNTQLDALWQRNTKGAPLSQMIHEDREESF